MVLVSAVLLLVLLLAAMGLGLRAAWRRFGPEGVLVGAAFVVALLGAGAAAVALYWPHDRFDPGGPMFPEGVHGN